MEMRLVKQASLREILTELDSFTEDDTICVRNGPCWTCESEARVIRIPDFIDASEIGPIADYFLEVSVARGVLEDWSATHGGRSPTIDEICELLIYFAVHDGLSAEQLDPTWHGGAGTGTA
jgi:hypothetical protein